MNRDSKSMDDVSATDAPVPFRLLTIYDSAKASREAAHASEVVLRELGEEVNVDKTAWDLNLLGADASRSRAAAEAARADVILIAVSETTPTDVFKSWVANWEKCRTLNTGLLALIPCGDSAGGGDLAAYLYETALSLNMDFLCRKRRRF
jgi:hypothetical protein